MKRIIRTVIQIVSLSVATVILPAKYNYVAWIVAVTWGLTEYFNGRDDEIESRTVIDAVRFLRDHGYEMKKCPVNHMGKWVAFRKPGLEPIQHGMIVQDYISHIKVKRKNRRYDVVRMDQVIRFFDNKADCYDMK